MPLIAINFMSKESDSFRQRSIFLPLKLVSTTNMLPGFIKIIFARTAPPGETTTLELEKI